MSGTLRRDRRNRKASMTDQQHPADKPAVSSTVVLLVVGALLLVGLGGAILIHIIRPDASATYTQQALQFLGFLTTTLTLIYTANKLSDKIGTVQKQTNGTLTAKDGVIAEKDAEIRRLQEEKVVLARQIPPTQ